MVGNKVVLESVNAMLEADRLPHAIIIEGQKGMGKRTFAMHIAQGAVCREKNKPCGVCRDCHLLQNSSHPDVTVYDEDTKYTVDMIRSVRQEMYLMPHMARRRVFIFCGAQNLSEAAQNAMLKVIEEPPAAAIIIFALPTAQSLLETVRSRCITFTMQTPPRQEAAEFIKNRTGKPLAEIYPVLDAANGNIGYTLDSLDDGKAQADKQAAVQLIEQSIKKDTYGMLKTLYAYDKDRPAIKRLFDALKIEIMLRIKNGGDSISLAKLYETVCNFERDNERNCNIHLLFSNICIAFNSLL